MFLSLSYNNKQVQNHGNNYNIHAFTAIYRRQRHKLTNLLVSANLFSVQQIHGKTSQAVIRASFHTHKGKVTICDTYIRKFILSLCFSKKNNKKRDADGWKKSDSPRRAQKHLIEHDQSWQHVHEYSIKTGEESLNRSQSPVFQLDPNHQESANCCEHLSMYGRIPAAAAAAGWDVIWLWGQHKVAWGEPFSCNVTMSHADASTSNLLLPKHECWQRSFWTSYNFRCLCFLHERCAAEVAMAHWRMDLTYSSFSWLSLSGTCRKGASGLRFYSSLSIQKEKKISEVSPAICQLMCECLYSTLYVNMMYVY